MTAKLGMADLANGAGNQLIANANFELLGQLVQAVVVDKDLSTPPVSPANGAMYIVASGNWGTGSDKTGKLAYWLSSVGIWTFITPGNGWSVWVTDEAKRYELVSGSWTIVASGGGGGSGDMLSTLLSTEASITAAVTLSASAFGKMHVCSGTTADYTVGLPAVAGNAGKLIGFRMAPGLTKLATLDANGTELIDGQQTRIMWANEVAILLCDGVGWTKISGKTLPMYGLAYPTAAVTATAAQTLITLDSVISDTTSMVDLSGDRILIRRPGIYRVLANVYYASGSGASAGLQCVLDKNAVGGGSGSFTEWRSVPSTEACRAIFDDNLPYASGDYIKMFGCVITGTSRPVLVNDPTWSFLKVTEIPTW